MLKLKILDISKRTNVSERYVFLKSTLTWDRKKIIEFQNKRLKDLILHAYENVPYYRDLMMKLNLHPSDFNTAEDLAKLPVLDRETIRIQTEKLLSTKSNKSQLQKGSSSGTTGIPINYYHDRASSSSSTAAIYVLWNLSGWNPGQKNVYIWGNASSITRWKTISSKLKTRLMSQMNIASTQIDDVSNLQSISEKIKKFGPISVVGYPTSICTLAEYFKKKNIKLPELKQVLTTAENLTDDQQLFLEKELAPTGDLYGAGEVLGIASRPIGENRFYILDSHVIVEAIESGIDGMKDLIVTDLDNYAMPFIRYKIGDMIDDVYQPDSDSKYPLSCFKKIIGRSADIITLPNGMRFHPINIFGGTLFRKYPEITKHKVIWNGKSLKFLFETKINFDYSNLEAEIKKTLLPYGITFNIELKDKLQSSPNGKFKYFEII